MNTKQKNAISKISEMDIPSICSVINFAKAFKLGDIVKQLQQTLNKKSKEMEEYYNESKV